MTHKRTNRGFTLIELLVATAIMAMIAASLYMAMQLVLKSRDQCNNKTVALRNTLLALDAMQVDFTGVLQPKTTSGTTTSTGTVVAAGNGASLIGQQNTTLVMVQAFRGIHGVFAGGSSDMVEFTSVGADLPEVNMTQHDLDTGPFYHRLGTKFSQGIRLVNLSMDTTKEPPVLVRKVVHNLMTNAPAGLYPELDMEEVAAGVRSFEVKYMDETGNFVQDWNPEAKSNCLPLAVKITLEMDDPTFVIKSGQPIPTIVMIRVIPLPTSTLRTTPQNPAEDATATDTTGATVTP